MNWKNGQYWEAIGKGIVLATGVCYGLGLLISNTYLTKFGVSEFSAFRVQYVVVGLSFLILIILPAATFVLPGLLAVQFERAYPRPNGIGNVTGFKRTLRVARFLLVYASTFLLLFGYAVIFSTIAFPEQSHSFRQSLAAVGRLYGPNTHGVVMLYLALFCALGPLSKLGSRLRLERKVLFSLIGVVVVVCGLCLYTIRYVSTDGTYSQLTPSLGGGSALPVKISLIDSDSSAMRSLGLYPDSGSFRVEARLLYESTDAYYLLPADSSTVFKCVRIDKGHTRGLAYLNRKALVRTVADSALGTPSVSDKAPDSSKPDVPLD